MSLKKCSKCASSFDCCNETEGCWCEEIFIDAAALNVLNKNYDNCLCPKCLKEYALKQ